MYTNRYPHMVHEYYVRRVREALAARRRRMAKLRTRADAKAYVRRARAAVRASFGPLPERTPLNPVVTGRDEYEHYTVEKVLYESRPRLTVTANLYLPKPLTGKHPGVLGVCGHSIDGKACDLYQSFSQGLVRKGFVVFILDPIDQGERAQYYPADGGPALGKDGRARCLVCTGHNYTGNPMVLVDDFFGTWRVWDAIRGLDYLLSRGEVDRKRIGVTGNSGGGTLSTYVTALDPRPTMAAPSCFVCSYQSNLEIEMPSDSEQNPPGILAAGLDEADLLLPYAPRPTLILSQHDDFFAVEFARQAAEDVKKVFALLGAGENAAFFAGPRAHGFYRENREAMYAFFLKHAGLKGDAAEGDLKPVPPRKLFVTPTGETHRAGSRRAFEFTADAAAELARRRGKPDERQLVAAAARLLALPKTDGPPEYRALHASRRFGTLPGQRFQFAVETEPGIQVILTTFGPPHAMMHPPTGELTLYVAHTSGQKDVASIAELGKLARGKRPLVVCDPRGIGQSRAMTCGSKDFFDVYGSDFLYASQGEMFAESYLGRRVFDVLRVTDLLLAKGAKRVDLLGRGLGSVIVAFAALLHPSRPRARIFHYLPSFELIARTPAPRWPLSSLPRGVLKHFDLPDVYRVLARRLRKDQPWDARMRPLTKPADRKRPAG
jgi:dienelactone hydrolase/pimeloyl-ACP methyl ester carboxylesterase